MRRYSYTLLLVFAITLNTVSEYIICNLFLPDALQEYLKYVVKKNAILYK